MIKMFKTCAFIFLVCTMIIPCSVFAEQESFRVKLYDTGGSQNEQEWATVRGTSYVFTNPEHIVLENGYFRVTYPILREDQKAGHTYFVKVNGQWNQVTGDGYGDYIYFVDSIRQSPHAIEIVKNTPEDVTISFTYHHKNYRAGTLEWAYDGDILLTKTISLKQRYPGVFVKLHSIPVNPKGEREVGFGVDSPIVYSERAFAQHPLNRVHVDLDMENSQWQYAVSLPLADSFYRLLVLSRPMKTYSFQFDPDRGGGRLTVNRLIEHEHNKYQVFLGAIPFDSSQAIVEGEAIRTLKAFVQENRSASGGKFLRMEHKRTSQVQLPFSIPTPGSYRVILRYRCYDSIPLSASFDSQSSPMNFDIPPTEKARFEYFVIDEQRLFPAGKHTVRLSVEHGRFDLDNLIVVPIISGQDFPLDIAAKVSAEMMNFPLRFEGEALYGKTGRKIFDDSASNHQARVARVGVDLPGFLTLRPYKQAGFSGKYIARFFLKVSTHVSDEPVAILDVTSNDNTVLARRSLQGNDFVNASEYQAFHVEFTIPSSYLPEMRQLKFRVYFTGNADVWVDYIEFFPNEL